ncbi:MAG: hypothetical protein WCP57_11315 [Bacteroidota bacterium]
MKNTNVLLFYVLITLFYTNSMQAQSTELSKEEKKEIKAKLKSFKKAPETYKSMVAKYNQAIKDRDVKMEELELELGRWKSKYNFDMAECNDTVAALKTRLAAAINDASKSTAKLPAGLCYGVQLGNYKLFDITKYFGADKFLMAFFDNETHQYVISYFTDAASADACRQDIKKLGIKDAFVTKYIDGKRVPFDIKKDEN